ncbi:aspartic proteinase from Irpex Lacteus [Cubamyces sp. BRFM 1775]|nr:aspartic proteinase from Irpex Lacteus [Cubamyces sp. BRFM 1775]
MPPPRFTLVNALLLVLSCATDMGITAHAIPAAQPLAALSNHTVTKTLPITKRFNFTGSAGKILQHDQARARALHARGMTLATGATPPPTPDVGNVSIDNQLATYLATVNVGSPPTSYELIVDSGSANTWVGSGKPYTQTSTSRRSRDNVAIEYGIGAIMIGAEFFDNVTLGPGLTVLGQSIGVASETFDFQGFDGVLGLGPADLTIGTLNPDSTSPTLTVADNLFFQAAITAHIHTLSFEPPLGGPTLNGELTFGGTDPAKFIGAINFASITTTPPACEYFGVNQILRYGQSETLLPNNPAIFDTGTSLILLATDALKIYVALLGAELDEATTLYRITPETFETLQSLFFTIGGTVFEFTANAQIWPRNLNTMIGGTDDFVYLIVNDLGRESGSGMDIVCGMMFLERFYAVFDIDNKHVGIANTQFTTSTVN